MDDCPSHRTDPATELERALRTWGGREDLWVFGYASLIWRPEFDAIEHRLTRVHGWHRALKMWSRINRGTPEQPGLVFALLPGGSCHGLALRVPRRRAEAALHALWAREMVTGVYTPRWLPCPTDHGLVRALAFTLSRRSPNFTGELTPEQYREIFSCSCGRFGTTLEYALETLHGLRRHGIEDRALRRLLRHAPQR